MKRIGIIGGLGPMATAYFLQLITQMTDAQTDQEHIESIVISKPGIPDRTNYILGKSNENPIDEIVSTGKMIQEMGADIIAIPCITAHCFHEELEKKIDIPVIHGIRETALYLRKYNVGKVGLLATDGTIQCGLFQNVLEEYGIQSVVPDVEGQKGVMSIIYDNIKAGKKADVRMLEKISEKLRAEGAEVILLGCTELSLIKMDYCLSPGYLDVMEVLAKKVVESCGNLRQEYEYLITK